MSISVIITALNEEENIASTIESARAAFKEFNLEGEIIAVDDGSIDGTGAILEDLLKKGALSKLICHDKTLGVGASFWQGVDQAEKEAVIWIPGDNENDPREFLCHSSLLKEVDMVVPFMRNRQVRSYLRNMLSFLYRFLINVTFFTKLNYTNGSTLYRKGILKELKHRDKSFFFQTDILIRSIKKRHTFAQVPYKFRNRTEGKSKAVSFYSLGQVIKGYFRLIKDIYL